MALIMVLSLMGVTACENRKEKDSEASERLEEATETAQSSSSPSLQTGHTYYYGLKSEAANMGGPKYNFELVRFKLEENGRVSGIIISSPYGTDGMSGSFKGVYHPEDHKLSTQVNYIAEGDRYNDARDFVLSNRGLDMGYTNANNQPVYLSPLDKKGYEAMHKSFEQQKLANGINTTDRSRLKKVTILKEYFPGEKLDEVKFMERYVDLDHNQATAEFLIYVIDPIFCGSGGCNLFVVNDSGKLLSEMTVVKMPVFTTITSISEEMENKGNMRDLFVWSHGMRKLEAKDGAYPSNPSTQPELMQEQLLNFPEQYRLVMDYLE
jgi:hypothetical protein